MLTLASSGQSSVCILTLFVGSSSPGLRLSQLCLVCGDRKCMKNGGKKGFTWEPLLNGHHDNITSCCPLTALSNELREGQT